jgi:hypothetical protein
VSGVVVDSKSRNEFLELSFRWGRLWVALMYLVLGLNIWRQTTTWLSRGLAIGISYLVFSAFAVPLGIQVHRFMRLSAEEDARLEQQRYLRISAERAQDLRAAWEARRDAHRAAQENLLMEAELEAGLRHRLERLREEYGP